VSARSGQQGLGTGIIFWWLGLNFASGEGRDKWGWPRGPPAGWRTEGRESR